MVLAPGAFRAVSRRAVAMMIVAAIVLAACGASRYQYVKNSAQRTYLRVPGKWKLFDEDQILKNSEDSAEAKNSFKEQSWSVGFDASPTPSVRNVLSAARHPTGVVQVRTLTPAQRDTFSQSSLRSLLLPFDPLSDEAAQTGDVEVLGSREIDRGGLHGSEFLLNLRTKQGGMIKWRQIALVDSRVSAAHILAITCDVECYKANESEIEKVVASWKVKER